MKHFKHAAKLKEFYSEQQYTHYQVLTINILLRVLPGPLPSHLFIIFFKYFPSVLQHAYH